MQVDFLQYGEERAKELVQLCLKHKVHTPTKAIALDNTISMKISSPLPALDDNQKAQLAVFEKTDLAKGYVGISESKHCIHIVMSSPSETPPVNRVNKIVAFCEFETKKEAYQYAINLRNHSLIAELNNAQHWILAKSMDADVYMFKVLRAVHSSQNSGVRTTFRNKLYVTYAIGKHTKAQAIALGLGAREKDSQLTKKEASQIKAILNSFPDLKKVEEQIIKMFKQTQLVESTDAIVIEEQQVTKPVHNTQELQEPQIQDARKQLDDALSSTYDFKDIDYEGCDPIIAACLKQGQRILCTIDKAYTKYSYVIGYSSKKDEPYIVQNGIVDFWKTAIPIVHNIRIKSAVDIIRWCESKGHTVTEKGYEHSTEPYYSFLFSMFAFCGKRMTPEAKVFA